MKVQVNWWIGVLNLCSSQRERSWTRQISYHTVCITPSFPDQPSYCHFQTGTPAQRNELIGTVRQRCPRKWSVNSVEWKIQLQERSLSVDSFDWWRGGKLSRLFSRWWIVWKARCDLLPRSLTCEERCFNRILRMVYERCYMNNHRRGRGRSFDYIESLIALPLVICSRNSVWFSSPDSILIYKSFLCIHIAGEEKDSTRSR